MMTLLDDGESDDFLAVASGLVDLLFGLDGSDSDSSFDFELDLEIVDLPFDDVDFREH